METQTSTRDRGVVEPKPVRRIKFDRWLFDCDLDNAEAARLLNCHPLTIGRYRKTFDDPDRRKPDADFIRAVETLSAGEVTFEDWFRPCDVTYRPGDGDAGAVG